MYNKHKRLYNSSKSAYLTVIPFLRRTRRSIVGILNSENYCFATASCPKIAKMENHQ